MPEANLISRVKVREVERNPRPEHGLRNTEEEAASHEARPAVNRGLDGGDEAPKKDDDGGPAVGFELLPADDGPLEEDICT